MDKTYKGKPHSNSAFTLIEISIGLVVVGILTGLALMGIGSAKNDTQAQKRSAIISSIEAAKNRYYLTSPENLLGSPTRLEHIAPLLNVEGENVESLFDLVKGTGKKENDLDLGSYQVRPANFGDGENTASGANLNYGSLDDFLSSNGGTPGMNPSEYGPLLDDALERGDITEEDLQNWEIGRHDGGYIPQSQITQIIADDAELILDNGGNWGDLTPQQQEAIIETNPSVAVGAGGSEVLNQLNPETLTPELVEGHVKVGSTWTTPILSSGNLTPYHNLPYARLPLPDEPQRLIPTTNPVIPTNALVVGWGLGSSSSITESLNPKAENNWTVEHTIVRYPTDPLGDAEVIGTVTMWRILWTNTSTGIVSPSFPIVRADINPGIIGVTASFLRTMTLYDEVDGVVQPISQSLSKWNEVNTGSIGGQVGDDLTVEQSGPFGAISFSDGGSYGVIPQSQQTP